MPGIEVGYDVNDKNVNDLGDKERKMRLETITKLWAYYDGAHRPPLKIEPGEADDNIIVNLCSRIIDKTVEFMGVPIKIELPGGVDNVPSPTNPDVLVESRTTEQQELDQFWQDNDLTEFVEDMEQSGGIAGHVFVRLIDGDVPSAALLDPCYVTKFWNIHNIKQDLFYRLEWKVGRQVYRQDVVPNWLLKGAKAPATTLMIGSDETGYTEERGDTWWIIEYTKISQSSKWQEKARDHWEYPFAPIVDWKNRRKAHAGYGEPDLRQPRLNDSINFIASNTGRIIKFHAHPKTIGTGFTAGEIEATSVDGFIAIPSGEAKITNVEMQSDLASSMNFFNVLQTQFFSTHRVVDLSSIKDKLGQITNFGVRMMFSDMLDMVSSKREIYGAGLAEVSRRALWMMGHEYDEQPLIGWDDPLPINRLEQLMAAEKEAALGTASKQTLAEELDRDYMSEKAKIAEEKATEADQRAEGMKKMAEVGVLPV